MKLTYKMWNFVGIVSTSLFSWEDQNWVWHSRYIGELCCILLVPWCKKVLVIAVPSGFFLVTITHGNIENMSPLEMWASCLYIKLVTQERLKLVFIRSEISILQPLRKCKSMHS